MWVWHFGHGWVKHLPPGPLRNPSGPQWKVHSHWQSSGETQHPALVCATIPDKILRSPGGPDDHQQTGHISIREKSKTDDNSLLIYFKSQAKTPIDTITGDHYCCQQIFKKISFTLSWLVTFLNTTKKLLSSMYMDTVYTTVNSQPNCCCQIPAHFI